MLESTGLPVCGLLELCLNARDYTDLSNRRKNAWKDSHLESATNIFIS